MDRDLLEKLLAQPLAFSERHGVPIFLDQWGIVRGARGKAAYLRDAQALLSKHEISWTYWQWRQRDFSQMTVVRYQQGWREPVVGASRHGPLPTHGTRSRSRASSLQLQPRLCPGRLRPRQGPGRLAPKVA